jgi:hypothetical protein
MDPKYDCVAQCTFNAEEMKRVDKAAICSSIMGVLVKHNVILLLLSRFRIQTCKFIVNAAT